MRHGNNYYDIGKNLSSSTRFPHASAGHMERQLHLVVGRGAATASGNRTHGVATPPHRYKPSIIYHTAEGYSRGSIPNNTSLH